MILDRSKMPKKTKIEIDLNGPEGNAFHLLSLARILSKEFGIDFESVEREMRNGDYEHLVNTFDKIFGDFVIIYR